MPKHAASSWFAQQLTGDLGGVTYVQRTGLKRTSYVKEWPKPAPTASQVRHRANFTDAVNLWKTVAPEDRETLNMIVDHHHMILSGYNLLISCYLYDRNEWIVGWARQLGRTWPYTNDWVHS